MLTHASKIRFLFLVLFALGGCAQLPQNPITKHPCGAAPVGKDLVATARHCPTFGKVVAEEPDADLKLVQRPAARGWPVAPAKLGPATLRDREFEIVDAERVSDGHSFVLVYPPFEPGDSGSGLYQDGNLVAIAIGNVSSPNTANGGDEWEAFGVAVSGSEIVALRMGAGK